ncbi:MAG: alpha/beta fold hydrolase [Acidimicrobiales bacterium]|nr:alpha/beta fold hydrolase [Acidimicrobiales bacterium]
MSAGAVLVHGAFHGPWCWERVGAHLDAAGVRWLAPELYRDSFDDDVAAITDAIDELRSDGPVLVAGHSQGGAHITALRADQVDRLVYVTAIMADAEAGGPTDPAGGIDPAFFSVMRAEGDTMYLDLDGVAEVFYNTCSPADAAWATSLLRPQPSRGSLLAEDPAWRQVPTTYVVCEQDRILTPDYQRRCAALVERTVVLDTDHSPMLCAPAELAAVLSADLASLDGR